MKAMSQAMKIGSLRDEIDLHMGVSQPDAFGGRADKWVAVKKVWASISALPPRPNKPGMYSIVFRGDIELPLRLKISWKGRNLVCIGRPVIHPRGKWICILARDDVEEMS